MFIFGFAAVIHCGRVDDQHANKQKKHQKKKKNMRPNKHEIDIDIA